MVVSSSWPALCCEECLSLKWERWILGKPRVRYFPSLGFHAYGKPRLANVWFSCSLSYPREGCQPKMWLNSFSVSLSNKFSLFTKQHCAYDCGFTLRFRDWFHFRTTSQWLWKDPWNFKYSMNECAFVTFMVRTSHKPHWDQICLPLWLVYSYNIVKKNNKSLYWTIIDLTYDSTDGWEIYSICLIHSLCAVSLFMVKNPPFSAVIPHVTLTSFFMHSSL